MSDLVYAVVCPRHATIKIGRSRSPFSRLRGLMTSASAWLFLWKQWRGREGDAHRALDAHRLHGEWFAAHPDVITYILDRTRPEWADAVRADFRIAGTIMGCASSWAAELDEEENDQSDRYGLHRHQPCSLVGLDDDWGIPRPLRLREGFQYVPGPLVPEQWFNDMGSEYWRLATPVVEMSPPRSNRPKRSESADPRQPSLFEKVTS